MLYSERIKKAMRLAYKAHEGQFDKAGYPYIAHPLHLAEQCNTESETIVALLHDVMEDSPVYIDEVFKITTAEEFESLEFLTRKDDMRYSKYIDEMQRCKLARKIKLLDLHHNLDTSRYDISETLKIRYGAAIIKLNKMDELAQNSE